MKIQLTVLCGLILLVFSESKAQISPSRRDTAQFQSMDPSQIPSVEELRLMGLSDSEIRQLMEQKKKGEAARELSGKPVRAVQDSVTGQRLKRDSIFKLARRDTLAAPAPGRVYGQDFFRNRNVRLFDKTNYVRAPENYILSTGDQIAISVWGYADYHEVFTIGEDGAISPREAGRIFLKGMKFSDAKALLTRRFGSFLDLRNSKIDITVVYSRVITVNVVGEVLNPGSYTLPAINTAFNALVAAGGPTDLGSVRTIYVKRSGKTIRTLDVYEFLFNPESNEDFFMEDNDYIVVPPAARVVNVSGEVRRPHNYEITDKDRVGTLLKYAGGTTAMAYTRNIMVKTFRNGQVVIQDINLDSLAKNKKDFRLEDGDSILIRKNPDVLESFVEISGAIRVPGKYEFKPGMRVSDLIRRAEGLLDEAFQGRAYIIRQKADYTRQYIALNMENAIRDKNSEYNMELQNYDIVQIFSKKRFLDQDSIRVFGSVRVPGTYLYGEGLTLKDALYFGGGLTKEASNNRIEISRIQNFEKTSDGKVSYTVIKTVQVGDDLSIDNKAEEFPLLPFDQVFVRKAPEFELQQNVYIDGEVNYPGGYSLIDKNETLLQLIERAGGVTQWAFPEGAKLFRSQDSLGYLFLNLKNALKNPKSKSNYILKEGDTILIPRINELVSLRGGINYPGIDSIGQINAPFEKGKRAGYYVRNYGLGFAKHARKRKTYIVEAGGFVHRTVSFGLFNIYPKVKQGSVVYAIYKPNKAKKERKDTEPVNWNKVIENTTVKITGVLTVWLLITQLSK